jgi:hypothetical protein
MRTNFFLFDSEQAYGIIFNHRPPVKMVDFHGEVTFILVFDSIRDILIKIDVFKNENLQEQAKLLIAARISRVHLAPLNLHDIYNNIWVQSK